MQAQANNVVMFVPAGQSPVAFTPLVPVCPLQQPARGPSPAKKSAAGRAPIAFTREHYNLVEAAVKDRAFRKEISPKLEHVESCRGELVYSCIQSFGWRCMADGRYERSYLPEHNRFERLRLELLSARAAEREAAGRCHDQELQCLSTEIESLEARLQTVQRGCKLAKTKCWPRPNETSLSHRGVRKWCGRDVPGL